jgi:hypothetical protein
MNRNDHPILFFSGHLNAQLEWVAKQLSEWGIKTRAKRIQMPSGNKYCIISTHKEAIQVDLTDINDMDDFVHILQVADALRCPDRVIVVLHQPNNSKLRRSMMRLLERHQTEYWFWVVSAKLLPMSASFGHVVRVPTSTAPVVKPTGGWVVLQLAQATPMTTIQTWLKEVRNRIPPRLFFVWLFRQCSVCPRWLVHLLASSDATLQDRNLNWERMWQVEMLMCDFWMKFMQHQRNPNLFASSFSQQQVKKAE